MKKYECGVCKRKFGSEIALNQHMNSKHEKKSEIKKTKKEIKLKFPKKIGIYITLVSVLLVVGFIVYRGINSSSGAEIGQIGSTHIHADIGIFLNGKQMTPIPPQYYVRSPYVHFEGGPGAGTVIHIHATGVPLSLLFKSLSVDFDSKCFTSYSGQKYCSDDQKTLKMFVKHKDGNWTQNYENEKYVFEDLDKILITYGNESMEGIEKQMDSVTDYSKDNSGRKMPLK